MRAKKRPSSGQENAERSFARNGSAFGTASLDAYVRAAHDFADHPPAGAQTLHRANGDTLIYDPRGNVFAVVARDGAPRALFKPDDGADYWAEQKAREARRRSEPAARARRAEDNG